MQRKTFLKQKLKGIPCTTSSFSGIENLILNYLHLAFRCLNNVPLCTKRRHSVFDLSDRVLEEEIKGVDKCVILVWEFPKMDDQVLDLASINRLVEFEDNAESVGVDRVAEGHLC